MYPARIHGNSLIELFWFSGRQSGKEGTGAGIQRLREILVGSVQPRKSP